MRYLSVFSGVEAATVAWDPLGWTPVAFSEVDQYASDVLARRFPLVPNLGDITKVDWRKFNERYGAVDVVVGGSPCQSFSIAGNREGLEGESRLMFEYIRCVREVVPRYFVWENVPGCLSSNKGRDFACLLTELEKCGYGMAWRVFDAQFARVPGGPRLGFFGPVPQRRRRVYLVGSLGTNGAAEILFERSCLSGDYPKGAKAREALAGDDAESIASRNSERREVIALSVANTTANGSNVNESGASYTFDGANCNAICMSTGQANAEIMEGQCPTLNTAHEQPIVIDRAAFNQGKNALYPPHIEQTELMDALVARGPHAVATKRRSGHCAQGTGKA